MSRSSEEEEEELNGDSDAAEDGDDGSTEDMEFADGPPLIQAEFHPADLIGAGVDAWPHPAAAIPSLELNILIEALNR